MSLAFKGVEEAKCESDKAPGLGEEGRRGVQGHGQNSYHVGSYNFSTKFRILKKYGKSLENLGQNDII